MAHSLAVSLTVLIIAATCVAHVRGSAYDCAKTGSLSECQPCIYNKQCPSNYICHWFHKVCILLSSTCSSPTQLPAGCEVMDPKPGGGCSEDLPNYPASCKCNNTAFPDHWLACAGAATGYNACSVNNGGCGDPAAYCCTPQAGGGAMCTCQKGYRTTGSSKVCTAVNICATSNGGCGDVKTAECVLCGAGQCKCYCRTEDNYGGIPPNCVIGGAGAGNPRNTNGSYINPNGGTTTTDTSKNAGSSANSNGGSAANATPTPKPDTTTNKPPTNGGGTPAGSNTGSTTNSGASNTPGSNNAPAKKEDSSSSGMPPMAAILCVLVVVGGVGLLYMWYRKRQQQNTSTTRKSTSTTSTGTGSPKQSVARSTRPGQRV